MGNFKEDIVKTEAFIFDVDGVMTDGGIMPLVDGDFIRKYYAKDGYAIAYALRMGYKVCIITGGRGATLDHRLKMLGITDVYLDCMDKISAMQDFFARTRSGERHLHGRRHPGPGVYEGSRNPRLSLGCGIRGDRSLALRFGVRGRARLRARHHRTGTPRQGRLGPRFPGHAQLEYRRVAVKPKSNERGCLKLLDSPFFIFQKQQELTTIEPSSSGKQFP